MHLLTNLKVCLSVLDCNSGHLRSIQALSLSIDLETILDALL